MQIARGIARICTFSENLELLCSSVLVLMACFLFHLQHITHSWERLSPVTDVLQNLIKCRVILIVNLVAAA
jgi:hypothetical protein